MKKLRADGQIQVNDYVELIGKIPESLARIRKPVYGTVVKVNGKTATVKPRYRRFELEIPIVELKDVPYEKFHKKQKVKKKQPVKEVTVVGEGPVKVVKKPEAKPTFPEIVKEQIAVAETSMDETKEAPVVVEQDKPAAPFTTSQTESIIPKPAVTNVQEPAQCNTKADLYNERMAPIEELTKEGNAVAYVVITILVMVAAVCAYFLLF